MVTKSDVGLRFDLDTRAVALEDCEDAPTEASCFIMSWTFATRDGV